MVYSPGAGFVGVVIAGIVSWRRISCRGRFALSLPDTGISKVHDSYERDGCRSPSSGPGQYRRRGARHEEHGVLSTCASLQPVAYEAGELLRASSLRRSGRAHRDTIRRWMGRWPTSHFVVGTAAIDHPGRRTTADIATPLLSWPAAPPRSACCPALRPRADGLDALRWIAATWSPLPTNPDYPALNLAQSVLLFLYEVRMAALGAAPAARRRPRPSPRRPIWSASLRERRRRCMWPASSATTPRWSCVRCARSYRAELQPADVDLLFAMVRKLQRAAEQGRTAANDE